MMKSLVPALLGAAMLGGCATPAPKPLPEDAKCDAAKGQFALNRNYTVELGASIQQSTGSRLMRVTRPGEAVTMDYRQDRVNVELNENNAITRISCG
jgi:hypothetical protein